MTRIAILGGGISGLAAAFELEKARQRGADIDWHLYEATNRLGGIVETTQLDTADGTFTLEGGPDGWVSDKPWARDLAIELGLERDLIASNDATRKTYIWINSEAGRTDASKLLAMPDRMRMMVPQDLDALANLSQSPLFSPEAIAAYTAEPGRADELKASALDREANGITDESVAAFVFRHFGPEVLAKIGAPLLSGVFGGDVETLSVRSVMAPFVAMEREHGSLILGLQHRQSTRGEKPAQSIFTSLRNGLGSLTAALIARLPAERLHCNNPAFSLKREGKLWCVRYHTPSDRGIPGKAKKHFKHVIIATSVDAARNLLTPLDPEAAALLPTDASSAVLAAFVWPAQTAATFTIPAGFGFLVPSPSQDAVISTGGQPPNAVISTGAQRSGETRSSTGDEPHLLAATFVDQKFPHRAPTGTRILRAFFGTGSAEHFANAPDAAVAAAALTQLRALIGPLPDPDPALTTVRRWPRSLPQYAVGHLDRMAELDARINDPAGTLGNLTLLGNAYRGVGLPDLIHNARESVRKLAF
jgi:oxygen-dependent protoporphyrinogen oxidase